jgi:hypothetical protein
LISYVLRFEVIEWEKVVKVAAKDTVREIQTIRAQQEDPLEKVAVTLRSKNYADYS